MQDLVQLNSLTVRLCVKDKTMACWQVKTTFNPHTGRYRIRHARKRGQKTEVHRGATTEEGQVQARPDTGNQAKLKGWNLL